MIEEKTKKISATAIKHALLMRGVIIDDITAIDIVIEAGLGSAIEIKDMLSFDKSVWADLYTYRIAKQLDISPLTVYTIIMKLEELLLEDLYFNKGRITIPHICQLILKKTLSGKRIKMCELFTPVRDKIEEIVYSKEIKKEIKEKQEREKRSKKYGNTRISSES